MDCPACGRLILQLQSWASSGSALHARGSVIIYPSASVRPIPEEVTGQFREDFYEACAVVDLSPKASAALSRRLVQHILREKAGVKERTLEKEIEKVIEKEHLPTDLEEDLDALRNLGNIAAHPIKSEQTDAIVEVEPGEAEWLLDLVGELLDFYFVRPAVRGRNRAKLNEKLEEAGKPALRERESDDDQ